jgi:hypothetical protein
MPPKIRVIGRVRLLEKNGRRHHYEVCARDGTLPLANPARHYGGSDLQIKRLRLQERPPIKPPPNEPKKPPIEEPEDPPEPPPPPNRPPMKEPPNEPDEPPVKEPPPKDPEREPPRKPPVRAESSTMITAKTSSQNRLESSKHYPQTMMRSTACSTIRKCIPTPIR